MLCDDQMRALSIFWLDSGERPASSVALINNTSVEQLECELAIFKWSKAYQEKYEPVIIEDIIIALANNPFCAWNKHICMRVLPNSRIECIIGETRYTRKFYHAYIPDKKFIDQIFAQPFLICEDDFFRSARITDRSQWSSFSISEQLNLLLDIYDSEAFIPYRRLITKGEEWIKNYTGMEVTPYVNNIPEKLDLHDRQFAPRIISGSTFIATQKIPDIITHSDDTELTILQMIEKKQAVWRGEAGKLQQKSLSNADISLLKLRISQKDELRLEMMYTEGLDALTDIEKDVFIHIDPFYIKYNLINAIVSESEVAFHEAVDSAMKKSTDFVNMSNSLSSNDRLLEITKFSESLKFLRDPEKSSEQKDIQVTAIRHLLDENESDVSFLDEIWQLLIEIPKQDNNPFIAEIFYLMEEFGFSREDATQHSNAQYENFSVKSKTTTPVMLNESNGIMSQRADLLKLLAVSNIQPEVLAQLQTTEDEITRLASKDRPAGYPEHDSSLYKLYWTNQIKTVSDVLILIMNRLSYDEITTLCEDISLS